MLIATNYNSLQLKILENMTESIHYKRLKFLSSFLLLHRITRIFRDTIYFPFKSKLQACIMSYKGTYILQYELPSLGLTEFRS